MESTHYERGYHQSIIGMLPLYLILYIFGMMGDKGDKRDKANKR